MKILMPGTQTIISLTKLKTTMLSTGNNVQSMGNAVQSTKLTPLSTVFSVQSTQK
ncbi:hypothetical protein [Rummeliibacillus sp. SL167]|uniref:hypothetical protein n=1 Tax=Rummeliibacillus sp. SL167 TaxID=2579792 RepID=UPI00164752C0|nr:hypothetical protein [Rummeliibacillus sp. SL167]